MSRKLINAVEWDEEGNPVLNLGASLANEDWMHSLSKFKEGEVENVKEKHDTQMMIIEDE